MRSTPANEIEIDPAIRASGDYTSLRRTGRKPSSVEVGSAVVVGLRGGGRVAGILARRINHGVVIENDEGADVIVIEGASSATRMLPKE